jgi:hypothetical protein
MAPACWRRGLAVLEPIRRTELTVQQIGTYATYFAGGDVAVRPSEGPVNAVAFSDLSVAIMIRVFALSHTCRCMGL